mgnify:CR=1 FL=1
MSKLMTSAEPERCRQWPVLVTVPVCDIVPWPSTSAAMLPTAEALAGAHDQPGELHRTTPGTVVLRLQSDCSEQDHALLVPIPCYIFLGLFTGGVLQKRESLFVAMTSCTTPKKRMVMKPHAVFFVCGISAFRVELPFCPLSGAARWRPVQSLRSVRPRCRVKRGAGLIFFLNSDRRVFERQGAGRQNGRFLLLSKTLPTHAFIPSS